MKRLWVIVLLFGLASCATDGYNMVSVQIPAELGSRMAMDSIKQLASLYQPGKTKFTIGQPFSQTDVFGTTLVKAMREKGYAVQEYSSQQTAGTADGLNVRYSVDKPEVRLFEGLYRVRLSVGKSVLTRAYTSSNQSATPVGAWAIME